MLLQKYYSSQGTTLESVQCRRLTTIVIAQGLRKLYLIKQGHSNSRIIVHMRLGSYAIDLV